MPPRRGGRVKNPCKGCAYWCGGKTTIKTCDYMLITGKRRPCPPGEGCTVKKREKKKAAQSVCGADKAAKNEVGMGSPYLLSITQRRKKINE